jgi:hypothetical protein
LYFSLHDGWRLQDITQIKEAKKIDLKTVILHSLFLELLSCYNSVLILTNVCTELNWQRQLFVDYAAD